MVLGEFLQISKQMAVRLNFRKALQVLGWNACTLLLSLPAYSQAAQPYSGAITDSNGGAIAGATVTVARCAAGTTRDH